MERTTIAGTGYGLLHNNYKRSNNYEVFTTTKLLFELQEHHYNCGGIREVICCREEYIDGMLLASNTHTTTDPGACRILFELLLNTPEQYWAPDQSD